MWDHWTVVAAMMVVQAGMELSDAPVVAAFHELFRVSRCVRDEASAKLCRKQGFVLARGDRSTSPLRVQPNPD